MSDAASDGIRYCNKCNKERSKCVCKDRKREIINAVEDLLKAREELELAELGLKSERDRVEKADAYLDSLLGKR